MIRRLNYTGRKRILRSRVTVRLLPSPGGGLRFDAEFDLAEYGFPGWAVGPNGHTARPSRDPSSIIL